MYKVAEVPMIQDEQKHWCTTIGVSSDGALEKLQITCLLDGTHKKWGSLRVGDIVGMECEGTRFEGFKVVKIGGVPVTLEADYSRQKTEGAPTIEQEIGL